jgi:hypothetical protein
MEKSTSRKQGLAIRPIPDSPEKLERPDQKREDKMNNKYLRTGMGGSRRIIVVE